jgi:hypothetical protein
MIKQKDFRVSLDHRLSVWISVNGTSFGIFTDFFMIRQKEVHLNSS